MNNLKPKPAKITQIKPLSQSVKLFKVKLISSQDRDEFKFTPGQFVELSLPGFGEAPFSIASCPKSRERLELIIRKTGVLTRKLFKVNPDQRIGIRGPLGNGFPIERLYGEKLAFISGGCGIAPIRSLALKILEEKDKFKEVNFYYGAKTDKELLLKEEIESWQEKDDTETHLIVEKADKDWQKAIGVVTDLMEEENFDHQTKVVACGPEIMMKFMVEKLIKFGVAPKNIYLSLERRMECGVGICQHCAIGFKYVCKDGPVFSLKEIRKEKPNFLKD